MGREPNIVAKSRDTYLIPAKGASIPKLYLLNTEQILGIKSTSSKLVQFLALFT